MGLISLGPNDYAVAPSQPNIEAATALAVKLRLSGSELTRSAASSWSNVFEVGDGSTSKLGLYLRTFSDPDRLYFYARYSAGQAGSPSVSRTAFDPSEFYTIYIGYDPSRSDWWKRFFIGVFDDAGNAILSDNPNVSAPLITSIGSGRVTIGRVDSVGAANSAGYNLEVDGIAIYDSVLPYEASGAERIAQPDPNTEPSLLFAVGFDEGAGTVAANAVDGAQDFALTGGTWLAGGTWNFLSGSIPTALGVPFLPPAGADLSPGVELGIPPELLGLLFLASAGDEFPPAIGVTPLSLQTPFAAAEGADHTLSLVATPAAVGVQFLAAAGSDLSPEIAVTPQAIGAPFSPQAGASWAPGITAGIPSVELELSFAAAAGQDFPPVLEHGIPAGVLAIPFAPELGEEYAPALVLAAALAVPFTGSEGAEHSPRIFISAIALQVPMAAPEGADHAPAVAATPLVLLVPFSEATGAAFAPGIRDGTTRVPVPPFRVLLTVTSRPAGLSVTSRPAGLSVTSRPATLTVEDA